MTFPVYLRFGPFAFHPHLFFELLAYFSAFRLFLWLRKRNGDVVPENVRLILLAAAIAGALAGSKMLGLLETESFWSTGKLTFFDLVRCKTILGGILGGTIAVEITKKFLDLRRSTGDLLVFPLISGIAIGRVGCFLTGLEDGTYGLPTTAPWGINFGDGITRHPTALYEIGFLLLLGSVLLLLRDRIRGISGLQFRLFVIGYCAFRLVIDALKPNHKLIYDLSAIQLASLAAVMYYLGTLWRLRAKN